VTKGIGGLRVRIVHTVVLVGALASLSGVVPGVASAESCPNEEVRAEQGSERLPDCRAFELVTPEVKGDDSAIGAINGSPLGFPDGNHVFYRSLLPLPGSGSGELNSVLSTRTASGWVNTPLTPPAGPGEPVGVFHNPETACSGCYAGDAVFTGDFSAAFVDSGFDDDPLDEDGPVDAYRLDLSSGVWSLAALPDTGPMTADPNLPGTSAGTFIAGVSESGSHVFFESFDQLRVAPGTPLSAPGESHPADMLYDRTGGHTYAVGVLPDKTISQTCSVELGNGPADGGAQGYLTEGAISPDGTSVVFTQYSPTHACLEPGVYLRENDATTVQLAGTFYARRSSDGSKVITVGTVGGGAVGVYEYDIATGTTSTITTTGLFAAASSDGSHVYYVIGQGQPGAGLYVWDNGTSTLIPNAGEGFASQLLEEGITNPPTSTDQNFAVATPDGSKFLFRDRASLTGYNNFGPKCENNDSEPGLCAEAYVYDATSGSVTCVSCDPTGAPPLGSANLMGVAQINSLLPGHSDGEISPDGSRVFFETADALVPQDTNGLSDVYEWENGRVYLISSGKGSYGSNFSGASSNGDDVFITTPDHLAPQDDESATQIYDARVDGGFPYRPATTGCDSGQCQGPQTPAPGFGAPASATFVGPGNPDEPDPGPPQVKPKPLTRAQKLAKALKACRAKHHRHERLACEKRAQKLYGHTSHSTRRPKS
jgi:hypothetical protein